MGSVLTPPAVHVQNAIRSCQGTLVFPIILTSQHLNPLKERELELRGELRHSVAAREPTANAPGLAIPVIENLGSHQGTYDTLNLTDNSITVLGNIPQCAFLCRATLTLSKPSAGDSRRREPDLFHLPLPPEQRKL